MCRHGSPPGGHASWTCRTAGPYGLVAGTSATPFDSPAGVRARVNGFALRFRLLRLSNATLLDACYFYEWRNCPGVITPSGHGERVPPRCRLLAMLHGTVLPYADSECDTGGDPCYGW